MQVHYAAKARKKNKLLFKILGNFHKNEKREALGITDFNGVFQIDSPELLRVALNSFRKRGSNVLSVALRLVL